MIGLIALAIKPIIVRLELVGGASVKKQDLLVERTDKVVGVGHEALLSPWVS